jgi:hypothetical protein
MKLVSVSVMSIYGNGNRFQKKSHTYSKDKDRKDLNKHLSVVEVKRSATRLFFWELVAFSPTIATH